MTTIKYDTKNDAFCGCGFAPATAEAEVEDMGPVKYEVTGDGFSTLDTARAIELAQGNVAIDQEQYEAAMLEALTEQPNEGAVVIDDAQYEAAMFDALTPAADPDPLDAADLNTLLTPVESDSPMSTGDANGDAAVEASDFSLAGAIEDVDPLEMIVDDVVDTGRVLEQAERAQGSAVEVLQALEKLSMRIDDAVARTRNVLDKTLIDSEPPTNMLDAQIGEAIKDGLTPGGEAAYMATTDVNMPELVQGYVDEPDFRDGYAEKITDGIVGMATHEACPCAYSVADDGYVTKGAPQLDEQKLAELFVALVMQAFTTMLAGDPPVTKTKKKQTPLDTAKKKLSDAGINLDDGVSKKESAKYGSKVVDTLSKAELDAVRREAKDALKRFKESLPTKNIYEDHLEGRLRYRTFDMKARPGKTYEFDTGGLDSLINTRSKGEWEVKRAREKLDKALKQAFGNNLDDTTKAEVRGLLEDEMFPGGDYDKKNRFHDLIELGDPTRLGDEIKAFIEDLIKKEEKRLEGVGHTESYETAPSDFYAMTIANDPCTHEIRDSQPKTSARLDALRRLKSRLRNIGTEGKKRRRNVRQNIGEIRSDNKAGRAVRLALEDMRSDNTTPAYDELAKAYPKFDLDKNPDDARKFLSRMRRHLKRGSYARLVVETALGKHGTKAGKTALNDLFGLPPAPSAPEPAKWKEDDIRDAVKVHHKQIGMSSGVYYKVWVDAKVGGKTFKDAVDVTGSGNIPPTDQDVADAKRKMKAKAVKELYKKLNP